MKKTYVTHRANLAVEYPFKNSIGEIKRSTLNFVGGRFTTDDEAQQQFIESLPTFKDDTISLETGAEVIAAASAKAKALRDVADKAVKEAQAAEADLAALQKAQAPAPAAAK